MYLRLSSVGRLVAVHSGESQVACTATSLPTELNPRCFNRSAGVNFGWTLPFPVNGWFHRFYRKHGWPPYNPLGRQSHSFLLDSSREPDETESPPRIPSKLLGRDCLYGFIITDALMETYSALDFPNDYSDSHFRRRENARIAIHSVAERLGLTVSIDHPHGHDDIVWFSYAKGGIVRVKQVPIASKLERFATELGITEKAEWHDAWPDLQRLPGSARYVASSQFLAAPASEAVEGSPRETNFLLKRMSTRNARKPMCGSWAELHTRLYAWRNDKLPDGAAGVPQNYVDQISMRVAPENSNFPEIRAPRTV
ncbi:hypothetical protein DFH09DRAFT_1110955 [Mycena vulgaris]|nr:hypothetical protein DFH09DRAFT_1110955 [Mycena vulgaris]